MVLAAVTAERIANEALGARPRARAGGAAAHRDAASSREAEPARVFGQIMEETARALGVASASIVRYDSPRQVSVLGGWSETGALLFPVGSTIELSGEYSALVEVYRTGAGGPRDLSRGCEHARGPPALARLPLERRRARSTSRAACGAPSSPPRSTSARCPRAPSSGSPTSPTSSRRRSRTPTRTTSWPPRARASWARETPSAAAWSATCTTGRSSASSRSPCSCA